MRTLFASLVLVLLALPAGAQEGIDAATAQLPKDTPVSIRVTSLDRVDALVKEWVPILKAVGLGEQVAPLEQMPASAFLFTLSGLNAEIVDKSKPIYLGVANDEPVVILHPAAGAAWEGKKELREGAFAILRGGVVVAGEAPQIEVEARGIPTTFLVDADAVIHVYLADLIAKNRDEIEKKAAEAVMAAGAAAELPEPTRAMILPIVTAVKNGVLSLESLDYGLSWTGERLESEGFVAIREDSGLRKVLRRAGEPGSTDLVAYLPKEAFMTVTSVMNPDWPAKELKELLEKSGGGDIAAAVLQLMSFGSAFQEGMSGRMAGSVNMNMMSANMVMLYELKPDVDGKKLFDGFDVAKANEALKKIGFPIGYTFEKAVAKHGETEMHRFGMTSEDPMLAMQFAMMQGYMAVDKGMLLMAMSPTGEDDLKSLLDRVARGEKVADHPHAQAMARLGRGHNIGMTLNLGALKPMAMMFGMFAPPEVVQAFQNLPDVLPLSTAITFPDGNIRWRGDWPVREVAKAAEALRKAIPEAPPPEQPAEGEEFD
jgi:hypothetical protein